MKPSVVRLAMTFGLGALAALVVGPSAYGQTFPIDPSARQTPEQLPSDHGGLQGAARNPTVGAGEIGQRQTRADAAPNVNPVGRLGKRVENRIENRIRNRIDRKYDPTANATSPFERAEERARRGVTPPRER